MSLPIVRKNYPLLYIQNTRYYKKVLFGMWEYLISYRAKKKTKILNNIKITVCWKEKRKMSINHIKHQLGKNGPALPALGLGCMGI